MYFCLRVDLDYVPWDSPDATEFGHGEPAAILRLLELAKDRQVLFQFFASSRVLRAFPAVPIALVAERHALDWLCKHPEDPERFALANSLFEEAGIKLLGFAVKGAWPTDLASPSADLEFLSAFSGPVPAGTHLFPVNVKGDRDAIRYEWSVRKWTDETKSALRTAGSKNQSLTLPIRPQVLAKFDPKLHHTREIIDFAIALGFNITTLRSEFESLKHR